MSTTKNRGFTLVELLVVIAIMGILLSLLLPAVLSSLGQARRVTCTNNLRHLATATAVFASNKGRLPASQEALFPNNPIASQRWASWFVLISPFADQGVIWNKWNDPFVASPPRPFLALLNCPAKGSADASRPSNSYICNAGFNPRPGIDGAFFAAPFNYQTLQRKANCVFNDRANFLNQVSTNMELLPKVALSDMKNDGVSNTALLSENLTAADWPADGSPDPQITPFPVTAAGPARSTLMVWIYATENGATVDPNPITKTVIPATTVADHMKINGQGNGSHPAETWRPSSRHPGVVVMAFADSSTRTIHEGIQYHVYQSLLTPDNSKSDMPQNSYVLSSGDLP